MKKFINQVIYACEGIQYFLKNEKNGRIQGIIGLLSIILAFVCDLSRWEWIALLFCIALVISLEMVNTSLERVCAMLTTEYHPMIKIIKDVAAGAVLWSTVFSAIIGCIIFIPHIVTIINSF